MEIWLKQDKLKLRLPILPAEFSNEGSQDNQTENVNKIGEVNLLGLDNLETLTLSAHFPNKKMYYDQYSNYPKPIECVKLVEQMKKGGVITLLITPYINRKATIESFTWTINDSTGDIYYEIETKSYKVLTTTTTKKQVRAEKTPKKITVVVKKGDTWAKLAKKYTGSSKNAKKIQKQNKMLNKKKPPVGKKVVIIP